MASDFVQQRELAFHETDMAGIAHFSNFFRWMESTEHAFLQSVGLLPVRQQGAEFWGWPRVRASCDYHEPLRYGDRFECHLFVKEIKLKAVVYFFRFRKLLADGSTRPVARGEMTAVYAHFDVAAGGMAAVTLEEAFLAKLEVASREAMAAR